MNCRYGTFVKISIPSGIGKEPRGQIYGFVLRSHIIEKDKAIMTILPVVKGGNDISSEMIQGKVPKIGYRVVPEKITTIDSSRVISEIGYLRVEYTYLLRNILLRHLISNSLIQTWLYRIIGQYINTAQLEDKSLLAINIAIKRFIKNFPQRNEPFEESKYKIGDIVLIDFEKCSIGAEIKKIRYGIIISAGESFYLSIPISSRIDDLPYHEEIQPEMTFILDEPKINGSAYYEQIKCISEERIIKKVGKIKDDVIDLIKCNFFMSILGEAGSKITSDDLFNYLAVIVFNKVDKNRLLRTEFVSLIETIKFIKTS